MRLKMTMGSQQQNGLLLIVSTLNTIKLYIVCYNISELINETSLYIGDDLEIVIKKLDIASFLDNMSDKSKTSLDCLSKPQLVQVCKKYELPSAGTKDILRAHLKEYFTHHKIKFQVNIHVTGFMDFYE